MRIYLDNNATTAIDPIIWETVGAIMSQLPGNPASPHLEGAIAREVLEQARQKILAKVLGKADPSSLLIFTSGATEANNLILNHWVGPVYCSAVEHSSVLDFPHLADTIPVNSFGVMDLNALEDVLKKAGKLVLISVQLANSETGIYPIQDWEGFLSLRDKYGFRWHCDAVQVFGREPLGDLQADYITISAHKAHGFKGVGALLFKEPPKGFHTWAFGGAQEKGIRPGTPNLPGILSLAAVAECNAGLETNKISSLRDRLELSLSRIAEINLGHRIVNTSSLSFAQVKDLDLFLEVLSTNGLMVSGKSACASGFPAPSKVLTAMFGPDSPKLHSTIRVSLSKFTTLAEIDSAAEIIRLSLKDYERIVGAQSE